MMHSQHACLHTTLRFTLRHYRCLSHSHVTVNYKYQRICKYFLRTIRYRLVLKSLEYIRSCVVQLRKHDYSCKEPRGTIRSTMTYWLMGVRVISVMSFGSVNIRFLKGY
uniref:Uncharacterized protein n=1 Tax=Schistocephalus solidus TaxID=70667 RepID=A0A0X3P8P8_SCHSO